MVRLDYFPQFEEILMKTTLEVINQVATRIPIILRTVEYLELDECRLASLHCSVVFISWISFLLWDMLDLSKSLHWILFFGEER